MMRGNSTCHSAIATRLWFNQSTAIHRTLNRGSCSKLLDSATATLTHPCINSQAIPSYIRASEFFPPLRIFPTPALLARQTFLRILFAPPFRSFKDAAATATSSTIAIARFIVKFAQRLFDQALLAAFHDMIVSDISSAGTSISRPLKHA
jgi:hypothetical protein